jgi:hypothetical protein
MSNFIIEEFEFYKILLFSHHTHAEIDGQIEITLPDGKAILRFVHGDLPQNHTEKLGNKNIYYVYYNISMYMHMVDILRYEEPLYFYYNQDNHESYVTTGDEPVGEGE